MCILVVCVESKLKFFGLPGEKKAYAFVALRYPRGSWFVVSEAFTIKKTQQRCVFLQKLMPQFLRLNVKLYCWVDSTRVRLHAHWLCKAEANIYPDPGVKPYCRHEYVRMNVCYLPDMSPTRSMRSHPEKASLTLCSRATVDCLLFLVIWTDGDEDIDIRKWLPIFIILFVLISCIILHYTWDLW